jgi:hypothetical protein
MVFLSAMKFASYFLKNASLAFEAEPRGRIQPATAPGRVLVSGQMSDSDVLALPQQLIIALAANAANPQAR